MNLSTDRTVRANRGRRWLAALVIPAMTLVTVATGWAMPGAVTATGAATAERIAGNDRYATAVNVARQVGGGSLTGLDRIIVVTGEVFADGLTASGLAGYLDEGGRSGRTAILLTQIGWLPEVTADAIRESGLSADQVFVVGGPSAVSDVAYEAIARAAGWNGSGANPVARIYGQTRYETSAAVVEYVKQRAGASLPTSYRTVLIANGVDFPDALAGGALAYRNGHMVVLSSPPSAPSTSLDAVQLLPADCAVLLGGPAALAPAVGTQVDSVLVPGGCGVERIGGADRYETAALIASRFVTLDGPAAQIVLVSGVDFADALTAAPLAGGNRPILLTRPGQLPTATQYWLQVNRAGLFRILVIGGLNAIGPDAVTGAVAATTLLPPPPPLSDPGSDPDPDPGSDPEADPAGPAAVAAGEYFTCGIPDLDEGIVYCWGRNEDARLGVGNRLGVDGTSSTSTPLRVADGIGVPGGGFTNSGVTALTAGKEHVCVIKDDSTYCWGNNDYGQLGIDTSTTISATPVELVTGGGFTNTTVSAVSGGGEHSCAIEDGSVFCWGRNDDGQLGDGTTQSASVPVKVVAGDGFTNTTVSAITTAEGHSCAVEGGSVFCWGRNHYGQLGKQDAGYLPSVGPEERPGSMTPVKVESAGSFTNSSVTTISSRRYFVCAVEAGSVYCWGRNRYGQLGDGTTTTAPTPVEVLAGAMGNSVVSAVTAGDDFACAEKSGSVHCWGENDHGQLGDGSTTNRTAPVDVDDGAMGNSDAIAIATGDAHACALKGADIYCWGRNNYGQLGDGSTESASAPVVLDFESASAPTGSPLVLEVSVSAGNEIRLPLGGTVKVAIDWGTGAPGDCPTSAVLSGTTNDPAAGPSCTYANSGVYTITVSAAPGETTPWLTTFGMNGYASWTGSDKVTEVVTFGDLGITSLANLFVMNDVGNPKMPASIPTTVTSLEAMFAEATMFNNGCALGDFSCALTWGSSTGNVTDMIDMFLYASSFNQDISNWNTSQVTTMNNMFEGATIFNNGCGAGVFTCALDWGSSTSNVTDMTNMFTFASSFNQDVSSWNTSQVTTMEGMFETAQMFNNGCAFDVFTCALNWNVSNVTDMSDMFNNSSKISLGVVVGGFNQSLATWTTSNVTTMKSMFRYARAFNNGCAKGVPGCQLPWNVAAVTDMDLMFEDAQAFNQDLSGWCVPNVGLTDTFEPKPLRFDQGAMDWLLPNSRPRWETCPGSD